MNPQDVFSSMPVFAPSEEVLESLDYTKPVSKLIWESTKKSHDAASQSGFAGRLLRGELPKEEYIYYMMILWRIYRQVQAPIAYHPSLPPPTYRPTLLGRATRISSDLAYLLDTTPDEWRSDPLFQSLISSPPRGVQSYTTYLEKLASSTDPTDHARLLSHAYVRYMGDLSGGQIIKTKMSKKFGLPAVGAGATFYDFGTLNGSLGPNEEHAGHAELLRIKDWFRQGMNEGVGDDKSLKEVIIREAHLAFAYNLLFFKDVSLPNQTTQTKETKESKVVFDASQEPQEQTYPLSSVVAVAMALGLAHFALVVGGFTGSKGTDKLEALMLWLRRVMGHL
ncbi:Heme oxygenase [Ceratobasidium theobromae]|uniref:Heme oxygenase n=1 Tax=Ceratobasidium theobromae TaxID=1582974 RepID=A0A5N5QM41_9AGAM|nr:Heme oxygenase [Ceratobasidium theobromae]